MSVNVLDRDFVVRPPANTKPRPTPLREVLQVPTRPPTDLGPGSAALALQGWRPCEIKPHRSLRTRIGEAIALWSERAHSRRLLLDLDDRALRDIGLERASAHHQGHLPFWRGE